MAEELSILNRNNIRKIILTKSIHGKPKRKNLINCIIENSRIFSFALILRKIY